MIAKLGFALRFLPLVWSGLRRKRSRTILTLLSILVAFLLFGLLQGVNDAFNHSVDGANLDRLYVRNRTSFTEPLPLRYLQQIESVPSVRGVTYASWFGGYYQDEKNQLFAFSVDPQRYFDLYPELHLSPQQLQAFVRTRTGIVISRDLIEKFGWKIGDRVPIKSTVWTSESGSSTWNFDIVGIFDNASNPDQNRTVFFNNAYFDASRSLHKGTVGWFIVHIDDPRHAAATGIAIDQLFVNSPNETLTQSEKENTQSFLKQLGDISFIVNAIIGAVFFTLLFVSGNTMMQSVRERIPEFAVLKTLGFTDWGVLTLVFAESVALSLTGAVLGLAAASASYPMLKAFIGVATLPGSVISRGLVFSLLLAFTTAMLPAWRVQRLQIVAALTGR